MASASTSASTVSVQKQSVSCGSSFSQQHGNVGRRQSCDTTCSSNSSCILQRRKPAHPLAMPIRTTIGIRNSGNVVRQRLLSAKAAKLKSVQNQLNDVNFHLAELIKENKALRTLQKRQDRALKNYEGVDAELPRLIKTHEEEIRVLREKNKSLRKAIKETTEQLKTKDEEINNIRDQLRHLTMLSKDKHLGERQKLKEELENTKEKLKSVEAEVSVLNRKLLLENKNSKFRLTNESAKFRQCQKELAQALAEIDRLNGLVETSEKTKTRKRFSHLPKRQAASSTSLGSESTPELFNEFLSDEADTKLEPLVINKEEKSNQKLDSILKSPSENIKARLSSNETDRVGNDDDGKSQTAKSIYTISSSNRVGSSHKLDVLSDRLESSVRKTINKETDPILGDYCVNVVGTVKTMNAIVDGHKSDFVNSKNETQNLLKQLKQMDLIDDKLRKDSPTIASSDDLDLVNKIWYEEYSFRKNNKPHDSLSKGVIDKNGSSTTVSHEDKKKLLATLRAIDNGESIERVEGVSSTFHKNSKLIKELFGDANE